MRPPLPFCAYAKAADLRMPVSLTPTHAAFPQVGLRRVLLDRTTPGLGGACACDWASGPFTRCGRIRGHKSHLAGACERLSVPEWHALPTAVAQSHQAIPWASLWLPPATWPSTSPPQGGPRTTPWPTGRYLESLPQQRQNRGLPECHVQCILMYMLPAPWYNTALSRLSVPRTLWFEASDSLNLTGLFYSFLSLSVCPASFTVLVAAPPNLSYFACPRAHHPSSSSRHPHLVHSH